MKLTLHVLLEVDVDEARLVDVDAAAQEAQAVAQAVALRASGVLRVIDYSVATVPCSRAALAGALALVADQVNDHER